MLTTESVPRRRSRRKLRATDCVPRMKWSCLGSEPFGKAACGMRPRSSMRWIFGSPGRTRTSDPAVNSRLLYQLSYRGAERAQVKRRYDLVDSKRQGAFPELCADPLDVAAWRDDGAGCATQA